jgi:predicted NBD/HSP70 family sugar kinase
MALADASGDRESPDFLSGTAGAILALIREGHASTRAEIVELTGLSRSTVAQRVDALLAQRLLISGGGGTSTGGRPPSVLRFNGDAGVVLAADLGVTHARIAIANLNGLVLAELAEEIAISSGPLRVLDWLEAGFDQLLSDVGRRSADVRAIGVGVPGPVEFARGTPVNPPIMPGWHGFPVGARLSQRFGAPALVDNDVNVMAIGEHSANWRTVDDLVFLKVGTGIGMGIIVGGRVLRGARGSAGDFGHVRVHGHPDVICTCGNEGCLEAVAGGGALAAELCSLGHPTANTRALVEYVQAGNADAVRLVRNAAREIGDALAGIINVLNPDVLVIGGDLAGAGGLLLAGVREVIYQRSTPLATQSLEISLSETSERDGIVGAAALAIGHVLSPSTIDHALLSQSA